MNTHAPAMLKILLAAPRGFCAGVDRAVQTVERALEIHGAPVYVRHEIVHNKFVVDCLREMGAIFVEDLDEIPDGAPVVFSAHGVPKSVPAEAANRGMVYVDATCPLVSKVHLEAERFHHRGYHVLLIGHAGHPEVIGTLGQLPVDAITLVEDAEHAARIPLRDGQKYAYTTQTTLSVDDAREVIEVLGRRLPDLAGPGKDDICYATTNRQAAVKAIAGRCDLLMVVGAANSSNSRRLVEVARANGCNQAMLVERAAQIDWSALDGVGTLGLTAGASAPEILIDEIIDALKERGPVSIEEVTAAREDVQFKLPAGLEI